MVDFSKNLRKRDVEKKLSPLDIYNNLDRISETGPMRPAQQLVVNDWFTNKQEDRDLIIKLHTGEGKTLIGLLILQSIINQNKGSALYVCPNIHLVNQARAEAEKFGIKYCKISEDNDLPNEFLSGKEILITHVQKVFNGKSIFGTGSNYTSLGCVVLDDSHACIDSIKQSFTIKVKRSHEIYREIINLFESELSYQGEGTYKDILSGNYDALTQIPYWSWIDKGSQVLNILSNHKEDEAIKFVWPLLKDQINKCHAFISGDSLEIVPINMPIKSFGTFENADQRILMSATTQDDSFFIKGLNFTINSVKSPIINKERKWSGEKMILIPSMIDDTLVRDTIVSRLAPPSFNKYGTVALVPSKKRSEHYHILKSNIANKSDIDSRIESLKKGSTDKTLVLINRYDGIDLPDKTCRVLIMDSLPHFDSLSDSYEHNCRNESDTINIRLAQKIEQGLGRSVRGEKDYSVIVIIGADLVKFINSSKTNKYFSAQTRKQIDIGLYIAHEAVQDVKADESAFNVIFDLISQSINRDEGWKDFYKEEMDSILANESKSDLYNILKLEKDAEEACYIGDYTTACDKIQQILDNNLKSESESGWYLQILAHYKYFISKSDALSLQIHAFKKNRSLLKPLDGITYKKIGYINQNRIERIKQYLSKFQDFNDLLLSIKELNENLTFGSNADKFEASIKEIGELLGFVSQRPDKEFRKGPDNLWCGVDNKYILFECKNQVSENRSFISKDEAGQMNNHCGWFNEEYNEYNKNKSKKILIIPTKILANDANFTEHVEVMRKNKLTLLKNNINSFIKEFQFINIHEITDERLQYFLKIHKLELENLFTDYSEIYTRGK